MADRPATGAGPMVWVLRGVLALAALAAPIITFRAFTDTNTPDPVREQRLRETQNEVPPQPKPSRGTADPRAEGRP